MRLLVHVAGEADLLLNARDSTKEDRAQRIEERRNELAAALAGPGGAKTVRHLLIETGWSGQPFSTPAPSPVFGALAALDRLDATPDLEVVLLGTAQKPSDTLDTLPIAQTLADVLNSIAAEDISYVARKATAVTVSGMAEENVVEALTGHLGGAPRYRQALVTWGSGPTALALGVLTALSHAGLPWRLVLTSPPATYEIVDPLDRLDVDPVVSVLVRWRMFAALEAAASENPPAVRLDSAQRDLVRQAARRRRDGLEARDCASLRAVLADAVVRRDGTASLAVRRYVTSRYEELLDRDRLTHPDATDLLRHFERPEGGPPLGPKLGLIQKHRDQDPVRGAVNLRSFKWLFKREANALRKIGNGSHTLRPPGSRYSRIVGKYLFRYAVDGKGWKDSGLPEPPVAPTDTVLAVWLAGVQSKSGVGTIGQQLSEYGLPSAVANYLDVERPRLRAAVFGVQEEQDSVRRAEEDAQRMRDAGHEAWPEPIERIGIDPAAVEMAIENRISRDTAALLLIPTGHKPPTLSLLRAMRRVGARHGLPLFVRQIADPETPGGYDVHLWPALTGGDLPLLSAAKKALQALELDVAWRLLAASAIDPKIAGDVRRLAAAFASRNPLQDDRWPEPDPAPSPDLPGRTTKMIAQRLALVERVLTNTAVPADRIHLLVLAADTMDASVCATQTCEWPGKITYRAFREKMAEIARHRNSPEAWSARILLLLNEARDRAPITHGSSTGSPDTVVAEAADKLASEWGLSPTEAARLPRDVATLLQDAVEAAVARGLGQRDRVDKLVTLHGRLIEEVDRAIRLRVQ